MIRHAPKPEARIRTCLKSLHVNNDRIETGPFERGLSKRELVRIREDAAADLQKSQAAEANDITSAMRMLDNGETTFAMQYAGHLIERRRISFKIRWRLQMMLAFIFVFGAIIVIPAGYLSFRQSILFSSLAYCVLSHLIAEVLLRRLGAQQPTRSCPNRNLSHMMLVFCIWITVLAGGLLIGAFWLHLPSISVAPGLSIANLVGAIGIAAVLQSIAVIPFLNARVLIQKSLNNVNANDQCGCSP